MGINSEILIGKAGDTGLKQEKQIETVQRFRDGLTKVLVATRVGEEGLDISEVNLGVQAEGRLIVLIAKDTIDQVYYHIGQRKIKSAKLMGDKLSKQLENGEISSIESLDGFL